MSIRSIRSIFSRNPWQLGADWVMEVRGMQSKRPRTRITLIDFLIAAPFVNVGAFRKRLSHDYKINVGRFVLIVLFDGEAAGATLIVLSRDGDGITCVLRAAGDECKLHPQRMLVIHFLRNRELVDGGVIRVGF